MRRWKARLGQHGVLLDTERERLTNLRYADDLLIFGKSLAEAVEMVEILTHELTRAGLIINWAKTKILSTDCNVADSETPLMVEVAGSMV